MAKKNNNPQKGGGANAKKTNNVPTGTDVDNEKQKGVPTGAGVDNEKQNDGTKNKTEPKKGNHAKAAAIFKKYPDAKLVYFTSDGLAFFNLNAAENHERNLKGKGIETIENS